MASTNIWLYKLVCFTFVVKYTSSTSIIFGFRTPADHGSDSVITLTLFWDGFKYQCNVYPTEYNTYYSCNASNTTTTLACDPTITDIPIEHGLQIDNDDWDDLTIDSVSIQIIEHTHHFNTVQNHISIHYFCSNQSSLCTDTLAIYEPILIPLSFATNPSNKSYVQIQPQSSRCVPRLSSSRNTDKYVLIPQEKTWMDAQTYCELNLHSNLASLTSDEDVAIAVALRDSDEEYYNYGIWIGLTDNQLLSNGDWLWIDNTSCDYTASGLCIDDIHWAPHEPNEDEGEDCAEIGHQYTFGLFNDIRCTEKRIFLCNNASFMDIITTQPQLTMLTELKPQHTDERTKYMLIYGLIAGVVLIVIACICACFYGKKWIKKQIREETKNQRQNDVNEVKVIIANPRRSTSTFEPGQRITRLSQIASGYIGVNKDSEEDEEKDITITAVEGYIKPWQTNSNQSNVDENNDVNKVLIGNVSGSNGIKANDGSLSDSEDLYRNPKETPKYTDTSTPNKIQISSICSVKNADSNTQTSDKMTRGYIIDPNTPGSESSDP